MSTLRSRFGNGSSKGMALWISLSIALSGCGSANETLQRHDTSRDQRSGSIAHSGQFDGGALDLREGSAHGKGQDIESGTGSANQQNFNEERSRRILEVATLLAPNERQLESALRAGNWQEGIELAETLESLWASNGIPRSYALTISECEIGRGNIEVAIAIAETRLSLTERRDNLTLALALSLVDRLDSETASRIADLCTVRSGLPHDFIPAPTTQGQKTSVVRLARSLQAGSDDILVIREAKESLRENQEQSLAAYVLAEALNRQQRYAEALPYWRQASSIPGRAGKRATDMAESTEHVLSMGGGSGNGP